MFTLNSDGSFEYEPNSILDTGAQFTYFAINDDGVTEVRTVSIESYMAPILDIDLRGTDESGQPISEVRIGDTFYIEASVFGASRFGTSKYNPLDFLVTFDASLTDVQASQELTSAFARQILGLGATEDGKLTLTTTIAHPTLTSSDGLLHADVPGFSLEQIAGTEALIFRQAVVATAAGELKLGGTIESLQYWGDYQFDTPLEVPTDWVNIHVEPVTVVTGSAWQNPENPLDANGDGVVTTMDALVAINRINEQGYTALLPHRRSQPTGEGEARLTEEQYYYDTNGDGQHTSMDILLIVNYLNETSDGEGEAQSDPNASELAADTVALDSVFAYWISEATERLKPKRRG
jgi:hypothetical protein